jgi:hypothetical protein
MQNDSSSIKTAFAVPTQLKLKKALPERLRSLGLDETWLQQQIANDTSLLGLGELEVIKKEKIQPAGGRIDFVLAEPDGETRYEVEVMLGAVDESHIIRTIEYWDIERQRYPMLEHRAVIVAEVITARFFNVIRLLNRAVPIIAIQLSAFRFADEIVPLFTRVLDTYEFGAEPEEEDSAEQVDRAYWEKKTKPESLAFVDAIKKLTPTDKGDARITYNKHHIALGTSGYNFCWFYPRKTIAHSHMNLKVGADNRPEIIKKLEDVGIEAEDHKSDSVRIHLTSKEIQENQAVISDALRVAEEFSHK